MKSKGKVIKDIDIESMFHKLKKINEEIVKVEIVCVQENIYKRLRQIEECMKI
jgi:hypothetical protein